MAKAALLLALALQGQATVPVAPEPLPMPAPVVDHPRKRCECSVECVCGCNSGHPCGCRVIEFPSLPGGTGGEPSARSSQSWPGDVPLILPPMTTPAPSGFFLRVASGC